MNCEDVKDRLHHYLDGELIAQDALQLEAHLVECPACRKEYEALGSVVETVRAATPLYKAPEESYARAREVVKAHRNRVAMWRGAIAAAAALVIWFSFSSVHQPAASGRDAFADFGAESHLRYARGALPLDIRSEEPQVVALWLTNRLPFHLTLPNYPEQPGQSKRYSLVGARLLQYREDDVAYLAYRMEDKPISLLIAASSRVVPAGGDTYRAGGLTFHMTSHKGLRMITWVDKGLSYALVSDLDAVGAESCVICHGGAGETEKFAPLRPKL